MSSSETSDGVHDHGERVRGGKRDLRAHLDGRRELEALVAVDGAGKLDDLDLGLAVGANALLLDRLRSTTSARPSLTACSMIAPLPTRCSRILGGTLPLRKPGICTCAAHVLVGVLHDGRDVLFGEGDRQLDGGGVDLFEGASHCYSWCWMVRATRARATRRFYPHAAATRSAWNPWARDLLHARLPHGGRRLPTVPSSSPLPPLTLIAELGWGEQLGAVAIDPELSDTAKFTAAYDLTDDLAANCVIVSGMRNGRGARRCVRGARKHAGPTSTPWCASGSTCARPPSCRSTTPWSARGMEYGGITPIGLPGNGPSSSTPACRGPAAHARRGRAVVEDHRPRCAARRPAASGGGRGPRAAHRLAKRRRKPERASGIAALQ